MRYDEGGYSLINVAELILALMDAAGVQSVAEIGAFRGELTRKLLESSETKVTAIDPEPPKELVALVSSHKGLELVRETSLEALQHIPIPDAVILDGDHNYYTMEGELRLIAERRDPLPLLMFHDVGWPLGRRDAYHSPERIPEDNRQPLTPGEELAPEPGFAYDRPFARVADHEGGPRNGILTAIENFLKSRGDVGFGLVPAFFGLGVMWPQAAPWADDVARIIDPWDRHPVLERLEANRVTHLLARAGQSRELDELRDRTARQEEVLRRLLHSRAFAIAERISGLRHRRESRLSRDDMRRALKD
jgi:hypothetical protein